MKALVSILLAAALAQATVIGDAAALVQANAWRPVSALGLTGDMTHTGPVMDIIYAFSNDAIYDTRTDQLLYIGGPHMAPMRFNVYDAASNLWRGESFPPGETCISHSYDNLTGDNNGRLYWYHNSKIFVFDIVSNQWTSSLPGPGTSSRYGSLEYFPEKNSLVYVLDGTVYRMSLSTQVWSTVQSGLAMGQYHNLAQYNPVYHGIFFGGGNGDRHQYKLDTSWQITALPESPIGYGIAGPLHTVDPVSGDVLFIDSSGVYFYTPSTGATGRAAGSFVRYPAKAVVTPIPALGVIAFLSTDIYPFLLFRRSLGTGTETRGTANAVPEIAASPNPFKSRVVITVGKKFRVSSFELHIFDITGKQLETRNLKLATRNSFSWNASGLPAGVYVAKITVDGKSFNKRLFHIK